jgi:hypothetical protein
VIGLAQPPPPGMSPAHVVELVLAGLLFAGGLRSLIVWLRTDFDAGSGRERILFAIHAAARVGTWFGFGALFLGYAVVSEPQAVPWLALVPLALAGIQLITGIVLSRPGRTGSPSWRVEPADRGVSDGQAGNAPPMTASRPPPGAHEPEKHGATADPGHPQPDAAEVESARILANEARNDLRAAGLSDRQIRRLADEYIALDRGEGLAEFVEWAKVRSRQPGSRSG